MDFDLTPDQLKRCDEILSRVRERLPGGFRRSPDDHVGRAEWSVAAELGLTGLCLPAGSGGADLGALDTALALQAFGRGCTDTGLAFAVAAHLLACGVPIREFARGEVRDRLLAGMASGELIAANAITEDGAGSDVGVMAMTAERDGDQYVLNGEKSFASNAPIADLVVTYACTDAGAGFLGTTAFAVPTTLPGITISAPMNKMGLHGCPAGRVRFSGCRVPASHRLGGEGHGSLIFQRSMAWERACLFAIYLGLMERQLEECMEHARSRRQFGRHIGGFQAVSHRIAVMTQRLEGARLLLYRACWLMDRKRADATATAVAKVAVSEAAVANGLDAVHLFGGAGYLSATGVEQQLRDSLPSTVFSGTTEIQREIIAKEADL